MLATRNKITMGKRISMRNKIGNILWGIAFIVVGLGFAGNVLFHWNFSIFFSGWWTLFIIVPCVISIIQNGFGWFNTIGTIFGVLLLLSRLLPGIFGGISLGGLIFPLILVGVGLSILFGHRFSNRKVYARLEGEANGEFPDYSAVFGGRSVMCAHEKFVGASLSAVFGGVDLNLRDAIIDGDVMIKANAVFGGIDIFLPPNVNVKVNCTPLFGGVSNKTVPNAGSDTPTVYITGNCMFGGIELK